MKHSADRFQPMKECVPFQGRITSLYLSASQYKWYVSNFRLSFIFLNLLTSLMMKWYVTHFSNFSKNSSITDFLYLFNLSISISESFTFSSNMVIYHSFFLSFSLSLHRVIFHFHVTKINKFWAPLWGWHLVATTMIDSCQI